MAAFGNLSHEWADDELDRAALQRTAARFKAEHNARLREASVRMAPTRRQILEALPVLLHLNHPLLPGFSGQAAPAGIEGYAPGRELNAVLARFGRIRHDPLRERPRDLQGLYLMGSTGSVAQTRLSDLDVWVVAARQHHRRLEWKLDKMTAWAAAQGVTLQCFAVDPDQFEDPRSAAGSPLLLDEFYRSATHIAGRLPLWWLVPADRHGDYAAFATRLLEQRFVDPAEYLDFGPVQAYAPLELFTAAVRELERSLETPHKSLLKLALLESYHRGAPPLSSEYKRRVLADGEDTDGYLLLARQLDRSFGADRRERLRRAWLIKTVRSNAYLQRSSAWRARVENWGYTSADIDALRASRTWSLRDIWAEQERVLNEYGHAFTFVLAMAAELGAGRRAPEALTRLRAVAAELGSAFRKDPKTLLPALVPQPYVGRASLARDRSGQWTLSDDGALIATHPRLVGVLAWLERNGLSLLALHPAARRQPRLRQAHAALQHASPVAIVNAETTSLLPLEAQGNTLVTALDDPLSYGAAGAVLVDSIDLHEARNAALHTFEDVPQALCALVSLSLQGRTPAIHAVGDIRRFGLQRRLRGLLGRAASALAAGRAIGFSLGSGLCIVWLDAATSYPRAVHFAQPMDCLRYLTPLAVELDRVGPRFQVLARTGALQKPTLVLRSTPRGLELIYRDALRVWRRRAKDMETATLTAALQAWHHALGEGGAPAPQLLQIDAAGRSAELLAASDGRLPEPDYVEKLEARLAALAGAKASLVRVPNA